MLGMIRAAAIGFALLVSATVAWADVYVPGYTRNDGTYVQPHYRSSPDSSYNNNWSVSPNVNPYTGQQGTLSPTYNDRAPGSNLYGNPSGYGSGSSNCGSLLYC